LLKLALDMLGRGHLEAATYYVQQHQPELARDNENAILLFNIGQQYTRRGEHKDAVAFYKQALQQHPTLAPAYFNLGTTYAGTKQFDAALVCFEHADEYEPNQIDTRLALARTLTQLDRADEAVDVARVTARSHPNNLVLQFELAITLAAAGRIEAAIFQFRKTSVSKGAPGAPSKDAQRRYLVRLRRAADHYLNRVDDSSTLDMRRVLDAADFE
jgi:tetratricopeptide (TPR) repeat protein